MLSALATARSVRVNVLLREPAVGRAVLTRQDRLRRIAVTEAGVLSMLRPDDFKVIYRYQGIAGLTGVVTAAGLRKLVADPDVAAIAVDGIGRAAYLQAGQRGGVPVIPDAYSLPLIHADTVHAAGITGTGVVAAVLDTGVDTDHPDLASNIVVQECFLSGGGCPGGGTRASGPGAAEDDNGHGTNVTGIIASRGTVAPIGVAPDTKIAAYKVLNSSAYGYFSDWDAALSDIIAHHPEVRVINMSLVSFTTFTGLCDTFDPVTTAALNTLRTAGVVTFVSAGNDAAKDAMTYPACVSSAVSVGAVYNQSFPTSTFFGCTDTPAEADQVTCWSNSEAHLALLAPGAFITSAGLNGGTSVYGGTSQAAPQATGVAALMLQVTPSLTPGALESRLEATGTPRVDRSNGLVTPRIDAAAALPDSDGDGYPDVLEQALGKNPYVYCPVMRADVDYDGVISILDLGQVAGHFLETTTAVGGRAAARLDQGPPPRDNTIDILDLAQIASYFLQPVSACP